MARILLRRDGRHTPSGASASASGRHRVATGRTALLRRFAPLGAGVVVLGLLGLIAAVLPRPADEVPVVRGSQVLADAPPVAVPDAPLVLPLPAPPVLSSAPPAPASPAPSPTTKKKAAPRTSVGGPAATSSDKPVTFGVRPINRTCRGDAGAPKPGDVICFSGTLGKALKISTGGTPDKPIVYSGDGRTRVPGIEAEADNVVIQGFVSDGADSTGIWTSGRNVTIRDNTVTRVRWTGEDVDGIRFFGDGAKVLFNTVSKLEGTSDIGGSHVDCMQSFATSRPGSSDVLIQGNRCEGIRAQCLMAEGPDVADGGGQGVSRNWLFDGNFCDAYAAAQSVAVVDVQNVTISNNTMTGRANKAFALGKDTTGTVVKGNRIGQGYGREVGFDDDSARSGYQGPPGR